MMHDCRASNMLEKGQRSICFHLEDVRLSLTFSDPVRCPWEKPGVTGDRSIQTCQPRQTVFCSKEKKQTKKGCSALSLFSAVQINLICHLVAIVLSQSGHTVTVYNRFSSESWCSSFFSHRMKLDFRSSINDRTELVTWSRWGLLSKRKSPDLVLVCPLRQHYIMFFYLQITASKSRWWSSVL